jgi:DNA polymerase-4
MKKPDAITEVSKDRVEELVWPLPASELFYCGQATTKKLAAYGIHTIGDIAKTPPDLLRQRLGENGVMLWRFANGKDISRVMHKDFISPVKSIGHGITCVSNLVNEDEVWRVMLELSQDIGHKLRLHCLEATGVQITIKDNTLFYKQYQAPLELSTQSPMEIALQAKELFHKNYQWSDSVRSVTVRAINLIPKGQQQQLNLYFDNAKRERKLCLDDTVEEIRRRFGKRAIYPATLLGDLKLPSVRSHEITMPGVSR